jgi:hypothetical protein
MSYSYRAEYYHKKYRYYKKYYLELSARQKGGIISHIRNALNRRNLTGTDKLLIGDLEQMSKLIKQIKGVEIKVLKSELQTQGSGNKGVVLTNLSESIDTIIEAINSDKTAIQEIEQQTNNINAIETLHQELDKLEEITNVLNLSISKQSGNEAENIEQIKAAVASLKASMATGTSVLKIVAKVSDRSLGKAEQEAFKTKELTDTELQLVAEILTLYGKLKRFDDSLQDSLERKELRSKPAAQP